MTFIFEKKLIMAPRNREMINFNNVNFIDLF